MESKTCKQCGRTLPVDKFRKYVPRGKGIYTTTQGHHTLCKDCEAISARAANAMKTGNQEVIDKLTAYYKSLQDRGLAPVTAAARRLLGMDVANKSTDLDSLLTSTTTSSALDDHCRKVRERLYSSVDEADRAHRRLADRLKEAGLYEEITNLLDEWYLED